METVGFKLLEGRSFSESFHPEMDHVMINETAAKEFNLIHPIGERIEGKEIVGLVKDFNISSLKENIPPVMFQIIGDRNISQIMIKTNGERDAISDIRTFFSRKLPDTPYEISYISDQVSGMYLHDRQFFTLIVFFTVLIVFIASMGLFGLSVFMNNQKIKEVAIRKTFGADSRNIFSLLLKDYFIVVIISNLVGLPFGYMIMKNWLTNFSFQVEIEMIVFITVMISSMTIVIFTVIYNILITSNKSVIVQLKHE
jgi:ABC-type antimicrobial peptide transport system permease subunit